MDLSTVLWIALLGVVYLCRDMLRGAWEDATLKGERDRRSANAIAAGLDRDIATHAIRHKVELRLNSQCLETEPKVEAQVETSPPHKFDRTLSTADPRVPPGPVVVNPDALAPRAITDRLAMIPVHVKPPTSIPPDFEVIRLNEAAYSNYPDAWQDVPVGQRYRSILIPVLRLPHIPFKFEQSLIGALRATAAAQLAEILSTDVLVEVVPAGIWSAADLLSYAAGKAEQEPPAQQHPALGSGEPSDGLNEERESRPGGQQRT